MSKGKGRGKIGKMEQRKIGGVKKEGLKKKKREDRGW